MKYTALIFDFDYTLADATPAIVECANYGLSRLGYQHRSADEIRKTVGMTLEETFHTLTGCADGEACRQFRDLFREKADAVMAYNTVLFPDTVPVLTKLKEAGIKTGIVTSKYHYRIDQVLHKYAVMHLIDLIVGFEDVPTAKPSPEGLLKAIDALNVEKDRVLYVGDTTIDAKAALNASVAFAAVTTGATAAAEFEAYPHVAIAINLTKLMEKLI